MKTSTTILFLTFITTITYSQNGDLEVLGTTTTDSLFVNGKIGIGTSSPDSTAILELESNTQGIILPRMSTFDRDNIINPAQGLMILNSDDFCYDTYSDSLWKKSCPHRIDYQWVEKDTFPGIARSRTISFVINNKAYVGTGNNGPANYQNDFYEYDPTTGIWTQKANFPGGARRFASAFTINGKGYICFGQGISSYYRDLWEYDPLLDTWVQKANFPGTARISAISFAINGLGYVGTGYRSGNIPTKDMWSYNPNLNTWTQLNDFPGLESVEMTATVLNDKAYVGTGIIAGVPSPKFWEYNPAGDTWTQKADFGGGPRYQASAFTFNDNVYIGLGGFPTSKEIWKFDHLTNSWSEDDVFSGLGRTSATVFTFNNSIYIGLGNKQGGGDLTDFWAYENKFIDYSNIHDGLWTKDNNDIYNLNDKIGIGTSTPQAKLEVANGDISISRGSASSSTTRLLNIEGARNLSGAPFAAINFQNFDNNNSATRYIGASIQSFNESGEDTGNLIFNTKDSTGISPKLKIDRHGNIGIGTNIPNHKLTVKDTSNAQLTNDSIDVSNLALVLEKLEDDDFESIGIGFQSSQNNESIGAAIVHERTNIGSKGRLHFATKNDTDEGTDIPIRMTLNELGYLGINTTQPFSPLTVNGNIYAVGGDLYTSSGNGVINAGGGILNPGINMISDGPVTPSNANGDEDLYIDDDLEVAGQAYKTGGGLWATASDERLKKDIIGFTDGLDVLLQIDPVKFKYNNIIPSADPNREHVGIIAQDVLNVAPYMIEETNFFVKKHEDENGNEIIDDAGTPYYTYDGTALTYILVNAVKELKAEVEALKDEIKDLKK